jgi:hypothetical protein
MATSENSSNIAPNGLEPVNARPENNETSTSIDVLHSSAPVPDILLSLAKDDRYISQITLLLAQSIVPLASVLFPRRTGSHRSHSQAFDAEEIIENDGQRFIERIQPELHLLASIIVHSATFVFYTRHFRGGSSECGEDARRSIGMESLNLAYSFPQKRQHRDKRISSATTMQKSPVGIVSKSLMRLLDSISIHRWQALLLLQTIIPYFIHRAGRGGWSKDLGEITSAFLQCCGWHSGSRLGSSRGGGEQSDDESFRNNDRLRGNARRRLFEAQRRRMMSSAHSNRIEEDSNGGDGLQDDSQLINVTAASEATNSNRLVRRIKSAVVYIWECLRVRIQMLILGFSSLVIYSNRLTAIL